MRRRLCLVTDRRRLTRARAQPESHASALLLQQIEGAIAGGIDLVQIREPDLDARVLASLVRDVVAIARGSSTAVVVNDRVDIACAAQAAGVHLRESSLPAADARALLPGGLVGRSVHSAAATVAAGPVDYLIAGTVFATESKGTSSRLIGVRGLAEIVKLAGSVPVFAIGGITATRLDEVVRAGATGVAAIGAFIPAAGEDRLQTAVQKCVSKLRFAFDSASAVP
jgi:thiamine-phosphate pyrophosphorylase